MAKETQGQVVAAAVAAIAVGVAVGPIAAGVCAAGILAGSAAVMRCVHFLGPEEQLRVKGLSGDFVHNGPGMHILSPLSHRSAEVVPVMSIGLTQYARVKNQAGEERVEKGPKLLFLGPYDELVGSVKTALVAGKAESIFVLDKLSGKKSVLKGPRVFVPEPQWEAYTRNGIPLSRLEYVVVEDNLTGIRRLEKGPQLFFPGPEEVTLGGERPQTALVVRENEYVPLKDEMSGKQWMQRGPAVVFPEPTWEAGKVTKAISLKAFQYVRLLDEATGKVRIEKGEQMVFPEPNEKPLDGKVLASIELKVQEYIKIQDKATGEQRVQRGPGIVFLGPSEMVLDGGKKAAVEIDEVHAAMVRDKSTGELRIVADQRSLFFPAADEEIEEVQEQMRLADHEAVIVKNQAGHYSFFYGNPKRRPNGEPRVFFLPPHAEVAVQRWSRGVRRDVRDLYIRCLDTRAQYMYFEFNCRTSDNVELVLEGTFFWQIGDVPSMMSQTGDVPGDCCNHARSQFIRLVSRVTLKEFMHNLHDIAKQVYEEDQAFYQKRGLKIRSLEVNRYSCAEESTRVILEEIIQETTNRMNRLSQAESENEVSMFKMQGRIEQERLNGQLLAIQHEHQTAQAKTEGDAESMKAGAFIHGMKGAVPDLSERLGMWESLRRVDAIATAAEGDSRLYYTAGDVNLSVTGKGPTGKVR